MTPKEMALAAVKALDSKKGTDIKVMEVTELTSLADYFVICTGGSNTQINALCDAVEEALERRGRRLCTGRATGAAFGCCWTTAAWWFMYLMTRPGAFILWSGCGATVHRWISALSYSDRPGICGKMQDFRKKYLH